MIGLTREERVIIVFLVASLAVGSAILLYKKKHPSFAPELKSLGATLPLPLEDTLNTANSDSLLKSFDSPQGGLGNANTPRQRKSRININTASQRALEELPYIGPSMAKRIVEYRNASGGFKNIEQLTKVKGIGPKRLEQLRQHVTVE